MSRPLRSKLLYASSNLGSEALTRSRSLWLVYFYAPPADVAAHRLLPALVVGILLAASTVLSSLNQVVVGWLSDRTVSRWGRRIPYVVAGAPLAALSAFLLFSPPADSSTARTAIVLFFTLEAMFLFGSVVGGPYEALQPEIAPTSGERVSIQALKVYFGIVGAAIGLVGSDLLVHAVGFRAMALVMAALALGFRFIGLAGVWKQAAQSTAPAVIPFREALHATFKNRGFRALLPSVVLFAIAFEMLQGVIPFYAHDLLPAGTWLSSTVLLATAIGSAVVCVPLFIRFAQRTSKRSAYRFSMLTAGITFPLLGLAGLLPGIPLELQILIATILIGAPIGAHYLFPVPLTADVIDDDSSRTSTRREATYLGAASFVEQTATSLAPLIFVGLRLLGDTRSDALGIRLVGPVAGIIVFAGYLLFRRYDLPDDVLAHSLSAPARVALPAATAGHAPEPGVYYRHNHRTGRARRQFLFCEGDVGRAETGLCRISRNLSRAHQACTRNHSARPPMNVS
jgi:GPH family glycoside/pentoside/hexuronide:cation symporter